LATRILEITEDRIIDYPGTLDEYEALKKIQKSK
jgi:hypothetical protein